MLANQLRPISFQAFRVPQAFQLPAQSLNASQLTQSFSSISTSSTSSSTSSSILQAASSSSQTRNFQTSNAASMRIGSVVPDFTQESTQGDIQFHKWIGNDWVLLVSHPADFTPVCTTELSSLEKLLPELKKRGVKPIGLSCDRLAKHQRWEKDVLEYGSIKQQKLSYPILADADRKVAKLYEMLPDDSSNLKDEEGLPLTVRTVFLIDNNKKLRLSLTYPSSTGRYWPEVLRCIDSIKLADKHPIATPEGWQNGDEVVVAPSVSTEDAKKKYPQIKVIKPYLRLIPQPK